MKANRPGMLSQKSAIMVKMGFSRHFSYANIMSSIAVFVVLGGGAYAASTIPGPGGVIHGCYQKRTGALRVVKSGQKCKKGELAVSWNQKGQTGALGKTGPIGPTGDSATSG